MYIGSVVNGIRRYLPAVALGVIITLAVTFPSGLRAEGEYRETMDRDYILYLLSEAKILSIKNFVDFLSIAKKEQKGYEQLRRLKEAELKEAIIEEMEIIGRYVFKKNKLLGKHRYWRKLSLNMLIMERNLVAAPFKESWEEHLNAKKTKKKKKPPEWPFIAFALASSFLFGYFYARNKFSAGEKLKHVNR